MGVPQAICPTKGIFFIAGKGTILDARKRVDRISGLSVLPTNQSGLTEIAFAIAWITASFGRSIVPASYR
nr:MAG TPA: hypothetical protein [Caudoviricetes sp.]